MPSSIIIDVRSFNIGDNLKIDILLQTVDSRKTGDEKTQFITRLVWFTLEQSGIKFLHRKLIKTQKL